MSKTREKDGHLLSENEDIKYTTCYMCACRCGIKVSLRDEKIYYIQGNADHPTNQGVICAKGSSGIMKQFSPARITRPLLRKEGSERGKSDFEEISWERAMDILVKRLGKIRSSDPKKLAFFTGRDQMQALTSYWAKQFGTPNFAAHGGFCSVNMATGMIYSIGGTSWEFGGPDFDRSKYLLLFGIAEDHDSNPLKIGISKIRARGGKVVVINPIRSGYGAIADEWLAVRPGSDGALILALINVLIKNKLYDEDFLISHTNASYLINTKEGNEDEGLFYVPENSKKENAAFVFDKVSQSIKKAHSKGIKPSLTGSFTSPEGNTLKTAMQMLIDRVKDEYTPQKAEEVCGVPADIIERIAFEIGTVAQETITLPIEWTDSFGNKHEKTTGHPVSLHAMRGLAAHSNGFQTVRALSVFMMLLGIVDRPGGVRNKPPFPKSIPPSIKPINSPNKIKANTPLPNPPLGFPAAPEDLLVDDEGKAVRIDKAFSWEFPLTAHGMLQNVITNAHRGDPYHIDTLFLFMANMAWNSTMNTSGVIDMLRDKDEDGNYKIPFIVVSDAFFSEQVAFSDLVLPDTTYLERFDCISILDRPIGEYDAICDSIRQPILEPKDQCIPFQQTLIDLAGRLGLEGFCNSEGELLYKTYKEFVTNWQPAKDANIGFLGGWRGKDGKSSLVGESNPNQFESYIENKSFFRHKLSPNMQYNRNINADYLDWACKNKLIGNTEPITMHFYSTVLQSFMLSAKGLREGRQPARQEQRNRIIKYFDPLPFWYEPIEQRQTDKKEYPFHALTQRPMPMYHSWDSQNAWLRQIIGQNYLYMNPDKAREIGIEDGDWVWVKSSLSKIKVQVKFSYAQEPNTVWTWNAMGKMSGFWGLKKDAPESSKGFLLNHLIREELEDAKYGKISNSDPISGQAGWYDLRVSISKADGSGHLPQFPSVEFPKHMVETPKRLDYEFLR